MVCGGCRVLCTHSRVHGFERYQQSNPRRPVVPTPSKDQAPDRCPRPRRAGPHAAVDVGVRDSRAALVEEGTNTQDKSRGYETTPAPHRLTEADRNHPQVLI